MLDALKNLNLDALPADVRAVVLAAQKEVFELIAQNAGLVRKATELTESNAALAMQKAELEALNARLEHFVKELNHVIYGARS
jgi:transposase